MTASTRISLLPMGIKLCSPDDLKLMTPYVLAEQGDWFENEIHFVRTLLQPGDAVIDIGANYGVYSLTAAALVGPSGKVWSFEPAARTASYLRSSVQINGFAHLEVIQQALSNQSGQAHLSTHANAELNSLHGAEGAAGETVTLSTLDNFILQCISHPVTFLKLDAEGEESNVIKGGNRFFEHYSPLVMFELKNAAEHNLGLVSEFAAIGYHSYKLIPSLGILVPYDAAGPLDPSLLNLFACKPERAAVLAKRGLLADRQALSETNTPKAPPGLWLAWLGTQAWCSDLLPSWQEQTSSALPAGWNTHREALSLFAFAESRDASPAQRFLALQQAQRLLMEDVTRPLSLARTNTLVRITMGMGQRQVALQVLNNIQEQIRQSGNIQVKEPFVPMTSAFDLHIPGERMGDWLIAAILDAQRRLQHYSSYFNPLESLQTLQRAASLHFGVHEIQRRVALIESELLGPLQRPDEAHTLSQLLPPLTTPIAIVDVGALMLDQSDPATYSRLVNEGLATVVGFEPNQTACDQLNSYYEGKGVHRFYSHFIGSGQPSTYFETNMVMTGSLYRPNRRLMSQFMNLYELCQVVAEHAVPTLRLDDLYDLGHVDYIKIDVQGAELDVFKGASKALSTALFIHTEVEFAELYECQPLFADVDQHLRQAGFQFHTFASFGQRSFKPIMFKDNINMGLRQLLWADALYVRDFSTFDTLSAEQLIKLALIAHEVYQSYDLAHRAIMALDEQQGSNMAQSYVGLLQRTVPSLNISTRPA